LYGWIFVFVFIDFCIRVIAREANNAIAQNRMGSKRKGQRLAGLNDDY